MGSPLARRFEFCYNQIASPAWVLWLPRFRFGRQTCDGIGVFTVQCLSAPEILYSPVFSKKNSQRAKAGAWRALIISSQYQQSPARRAFSGRDNWKNRKNRIYQIAQPFLTWYCIIKGLTEKPMHDIRRSPPGARRFCFCKNSRTSGRKE